MSKYMLGECLGCMKLSRRQRNWVDGFCPECIIDNLEQRQDEINERQRNEITNQALLIFGKGLAKVLMVLVVKYPDFKEGLCDMGSAVDKLVTLAEDV